MNKSDQINELAAALVAFQGSMAAVPKLSKNPFFKSNYADLPTIWEHIRENLSACGLSVVQGSSTGAEPYIWTNEKDQINVISYIEIETMLLHGSGQWISDCCRLPISKADPQGAGSAITYARRYGLASMLGLVADEDDDGNHASGNRTPNTAPQPQGQKDNPPANNPAMTKALEEAPASAKSEADEVAAIWGHGAAKASQDVILNLCRDLAAAGDPALTGHKKLADYVLDRFDEPLAKLSVKSVNVLIEELKERLAERKAIAESGDDDDRPTDIVPISDQQLTTLTRLCDLKNFAPEDCAVEYSGGSVNALADLSETQAKEAIKNVQRMTKL